MKHRLVRRGDRILVTGADGFAGKHLCSRLRTMCEVVEWGDEVDVTSGTLPEVHPTHVVHLAAATSVVESWEAPPRYYSVNAIGTANVLEVCRRTAASITYVSTWVYGNAEKPPVSESAPPAPVSPYHHSKWLGELICVYFAQRFGVPVTILRAANLYGPGQREGFLIPTLIRQALEKPAIEIKDPAPRRDYLFIDDLIEMILLSIPVNGVNVYNVGSGKSYSVMDVARVVMQEVGAVKPLITRAFSRRDEILDSRMDVTRAFNEVGWRPTVSLEEGIRRTVAWAKERR